MLYLSGLEEPSGQTVSKKDLVAEKDSGFKDRPARFLPVVMARTAIFAALSLVACWLAFSWYEGQLLAEQKIKYRAELMPYASALSTALNEKISLLSGIEAFVQTSLRDKDLRSRFGIFASGLYTANSGIRAIQVFPPAGPEMIYPVAGNEAVSGGGLQKLLQDERPGVRADIDEAVTTRRTVLSGPYELRQGGLGLVARKALFDRGAFWGLTVIVLDIPPLLKQSGVDPPASRRLLMALKDGSGRIFAGKASVFDADPIVIDVDVEGETWRLAGSPSGGWFGTYGPNLNSFRALGFFVVVLLVGLVYSLSNQGLRLREAVEKKTTALRESEGKLKEAQRLGRIGSWEYDLATKRIRWSDQVFELYGRDPALGSPSLEEEALYYKPETLKKLRDMANLAAKEGGSLFYDFQAELPDGSSPYFSGSVRAERDGSGKIVKLFGTVQDIAERKRAEKEIRKLNESLEEKVAERTTQLEEANKNLEAFTYSVSHDLRAPLRVINGFSGILIEDYGTMLDEEGRRICSIIGKNARNMGELIDDLLSFSHLGRASLNIGPTDMTPLVRSVFTEIASPAERGLIDFGVEELPVAAADPVLIKQVWANLLSNAVKFSAKKAKPEIRVGALMRNGEIVYSVRDNGAGFDMKYADKLFGVFQRLHSASEFEGTGVGLAIVKRIVNLHGGTIWAESEPGKGAVFYFSLKKGNGDIA